MKNLDLSLVREFEFVKCNVVKLKWFDFLIAGLTTGLPVFGIYLACLLNNEEHIFVAIPWLEEATYKCQRLLYMFFDYTDNGAYLTFNEDINYYLYFSIVGFMASILLINIYGRMRIKSPELQKDFIKKYSRDILSVTIIMLSLYFYQLIMTALDTPSEHYSICAGISTAVTFSVILAIVVLIVRTIIYYTLYKLTEYERA